MSETSETPTVLTTTAPAPTARQTPKVFEVAAWVAIVAGTVFVVAVIFFTGYALGKHSGHHGFHHHHAHKHHAMIMHPGIPGGGPASVRPSVGLTGPNQVPSSVSSPRVTTP